ncbi:uncharacterized protein LOC144663148 [Oculina patagonica]
MKSSGPFYLALIERRKSQVWYKQQRMGISGVSTNVSEETQSWPGNITGVTGHTNERSLADYEEGDDNEQRLVFYNHYRFISTCMICTGDQLGR